MPFNPWSVGRPPRKQETRQFDERGQQFSLTLRSPTFPELVASRSHAQEWIDDFVERKLALPLPTEGEPVFLSVELAQLIAALQCMQVPEAGEERWELMTWMGLCLNFPRSWLEIATWAGGLMEATEEASGN